jgi:hypothetical protein
VNCDRACLDVGCKVCYGVARSNKDSRISPSAHGNVTVDKLYESRYYEISLKTVKIDNAINVD